MQILHKEVRKLIRAERRRNQGVLAGLLGWTFAVLGIFTVGILFVPLAILCSVIGFARGDGSLSIPGIAVSLPGALLSAIGVAVSPSMWFLVTGLLSGSRTRGITACYG
jgi:hypothetical protein